MLLQLGQAVVCTLPHNLGLLPVLRAVVQAGADVVEVFARRPKVRAQRRNQLPVPDCIPPVDVGQLWQTWDVRGGGGGCEGS